MVKTIGEAVSGVDAALLVVEPRLSGKGSRDGEDSIAGPAERELLEQLRKNRLPAILAINKIDTLEDKRSLLACIDRWRKEYDFTAILPTSAVTGEGVEELIGELSAFAFDSPPLFPR